MFIIHAHCNTGAMEHAKHHPQGNMHLLQLPRKILIRILALAYFVKQNNEPDDLERGTMAPGRPELLRNLPLVCRLFRELTLSPVFSRIASVTERMVPRTDFEGLTRYWCTRAHNILVGPPSADATPCFWDTIRIFVCHHGHHCTTRIARCVTRSCLVQELDVSISGLYNHPERLPQISKAMVPIIAASSNLKVLRLAGALEVGHMFRELQARLPELRQLGTVYVAGGKDKWEIHTCIEMLALLPALATLQIEFCRYSVSHFYWFIRWYIRPVVY